jgi:hypothetical protein
MKYIETRISEISDPTFQALIDELCDCVRFNRDEASESTLSFLLMAIGKEERRLSLLCASVSVVLGTKVSKLPFGSVVWQVCKELGQMTGTPIEAFDTQTVLTVIKKSYKVFCPKPARLKLTKVRKSYHHTTSLILRRRQNGSL